MYNTSLYLFYSFDNISALGENDFSIVDMTGRSNNAAPQGGARFISLGRYNGGYELDGIDDRITVNDMPITKSLPFTVSIWFKTNTAPDSTGVINKYTPASWNGFQIMLDNTPAICSWYLRDNSNYVAIAQTQGVGAVSCPSISLGRWTQVVVSVNTSGMYMYLDGIYAQSSGWTGSAGATTETINLTIGRYSTLHFNGTIDELRMWNRTLDSSEIYQQYVSNLRKINTMTWQLYVNQSKNTTAGLANGTYIYKIFAENTTNTQESAQRSVIIGLLADIPEWGSLGFLGILVVLGCALCYNRYQRE